jgi:hypothetical protein
MLVPISMILASQLVVVIADDAPVDLLTRLQDQQMARKLPNLPEPE